MNSLSSNSSFSDGRLDFQYDDFVSDTSSSRGSESRLNSMSSTTPVFLDQARTQRSQDSVANTRDSIAEESPSGRPLLVTNNRGHSNNSLEGSSSLPRSAPSNDGTVVRTMSSTRAVRRKGRCEVIAVGGATGLGKSRLVQSVQSTARSAGYFASAKFDKTKKAPFDPILKVMSSMFRQVFSEADVSSEFHNSLRNFLKSTGVWTALRSYLNLPDWLLNTGSTPKTPQQRDMDPTIALRRASSPAIHCGTSGHTAEAWLRSGGASKSTKFMSVFIDVLRLFAMQKLCIWTLEDVQNADSESAGTCCSNVLPWIDPMS